MEKLAIHGGAPVRDKKLYYGHQCIDEEDIKAVVNVLRGDYLTCGPKIAEIEARFCKVTHAKHAVVVSNGTAALHIACMAAGVGPGDEVITTPITFAASANCAVYCGATPVFADINPETYNIDPDSIRAHITPKTKAVVAVDFTGQAVEIEKIRAICDEYHLVFIEDAAHSIGTTYNGEPVGSLADMTCFSFHPVKTVTSGEGGAVTTNNKEFYEKLVLAHAHGITHEAGQMEEKDIEGPWYYEMIAEGYNYRMTDFQAALLMSQLNKLEKFSNRRKDIVAKYDAAFSKLPQIFVQKTIPQSDTTRHCQVHYVPVYWFPFYQHKGYKKGLCPKAEEMYKGIMSIPLYPALTDRDVDDVIHAVTKIVDYYKK